MGLLGILITGLFVMGSGAIAYRWGVPIAIVWPPVFAFAFVFVWTGLLHPGQYDGTVAVVIAPIVFVGYIGCGGGLLARGVMLRG